MLKCFCSNFSLSLSYQVFNYLYTAAWGKYLTLNSTSGLTLIVDLVQYLDSTIESINRVKSSARRQIIEGTRDSYSHEIDMKIEEANRFINDDILPAIESASKALDGDMNKIVDEVKKMQDEQKENLKKYQEHQRNLAKTAGLRSFFNVLGFVGSFASVLGPYGAAAGAVAGAVSQVGLGFSSPGNLQRGKPIPPGVKELLDEQQKALEARVKERIEALHELLAAFGIDYDDGEEDSTESAAAKAKTEEVKSWLTQLQETALNETTFNSIHGELSKFVTEQKAELDSAKNDLNARNEKLLSRLTKLESGLTVFKASFTLYKTFLSDDTKMKEVSKAIKEKSKEVDQLRRLESSVYTTMWPMLDEMRHQMDAIGDSAEGQHGASLDLKKWKLQSVLRDTKFQLKVLTKAFQAGDHLVHTIQKLDDAFTTLIKIFDRIDAYRDQKKLSDFIANIASDDIENIDVGEELRPAFLSLDLMINSNVVLSQYQEATSALKQAVFPFITRYMQDYNLPTTLQMIDDTESLVRTAANQLTALRTLYVQRNRAAVTTDDPHIISGTFDVRGDRARPFYVWQSATIRDELKRLLRGEEITLYADIAEAKIRVNALKFNSIEVLLRTTDATRQKHLDRSLKRFDVSLTHLGTSYYRCGPEFYTIAGANETIYYSVEKDQDGKPARTNSVYNKLTSSAPMLSPYSRYKLQLVNIEKEEEEEESQGERKIPEDLVKFSEYVDIVLVGRGEYVSRKANVCGAQLDKFYQKDTSISSAIKVIAQQAKKE